MIQSRSAPLRIVSGHYPSEEIQGVDQSRVTPSSGDIRRIEQERKILAEAYIPIQNAVIMDGPFSFPVENVVVTSPYGSRRVFNGQLRSYHGGVDFRAREGTPIYAAQSGVVRLARNLFYAGNHVLIEHGMGIYTSYSHLSVIQVSEGDRVEKGQTLGLAGATGRVTAAHLHWTVNVHGVGVSPLQFAEILNKTYKTVS
jgi:murein DD-endopeptidase MepM/ murein hydrolase activator NlpD